MLATSKVIDSINRFYTTEFGGIHITATSARCSHLGACRFIDVILYNAFLLLGYITNQQQFLLRYFQNIRFVQTSYTYIDNVSVLTENQYEIWRQFPIFV